LDGLWLNKHITAFILLDESEPFLLIEPLDFTSGIACILLSNNNLLSRIRIMTESKAAGKIRKAWQPPLHHDVFIQT